MDMPIEDMKLPEILPFTRWTSFSQMDFDTYAIDELAQHTTTGQYVYDESTASYSLRDWTVKEDVDTPNPATEYLYEQLNRN